MARRKSLEDDQLTDANYYILLSMMEPIHGYGIMQKSREISNKSFEIAPASLYTSLKKILDAELIKLDTTSDIDKKVYSLTYKGLDFLKRDYTARKKIIEHGEFILVGI